MTEDAKMSVGQSLIQGAEEALAIARGELAPDAVYVPETVDVAAIRKRLKLSQTAFAERYGLPIGTIRDWEQDRRSPDRAAIVLLTIIDRDAEFVARTLSSG